MFLVKFRTFKAERGNKFLPQSKHCPIMVGNKHVHVVAFYNVV